MCPKQYPYHVIATCSVYRMTVIVDTMSTMATHPVSCGVVGTLSTCQHRHNHHYRPASIASRVWQSVCGFQSSLHLVVGNSGHLASLLMTQQMSPSLLMTVANNCPPPPPPHCQRHGQTSKAFTLDGCCSHHHRVGFTRPLEVSCIVTMTTTDVIAQVI